MRIGFVGCGMAADIYIPSLRKYPHLELAAVHDRDQKRASQVEAYYSVRSCPTLEALLADPSVELIVNLTNPDSHFEVTRACLEAGKHVYSEKPLAMVFSQARELVELANAKRLHLSAAPCGLLGETAQNLWRALRRGEIGRVRVVYAELDDGPVHLQEPHLYRSASGAPFPYRDEFAVGCTVEHAAYYLSWLTAFFGPATTVTSFSACLWPDRQLTAEESLNVTTPDFSVGCITFRSGVVVRLTCSTVAPYDHGMQIVGDGGILTVSECWNYSAPVRLEKYSKRWFQTRSATNSRAFPLLEWMRTGSSVYPPLKKVSREKRYRQHRQDFARGIADLAQATVEGRPPRLPADYCLHVNELALAIQNASATPYQVTSTFKPLEPMDDAALNEILSIDW